MNKINSFPGRAELLKWLENQDKLDLRDVNGHLHTPFSFSAFENITQAFEMAQAEQVDVLGINDFYVTDGYQEFHGLAVKYNKFPMFNIEFISLNRQFQQENTRVNDPNNPGRTYFSGKGLSFPTRLENPYLSKLNNLITESQRQVKEMIDKTSLWLGEINAGFSLDYQNVKKKFAQELVRERHIAKAIRIEAENKYPVLNDRVDFYTRLFSGSIPKSDIQQASEIEIEIRNNLLKSGGKAFVEEDEKAFLPVEEVKNLILQMGGIPCYPVLLDDSKGNFTDFEKDWEKMANYLLEKEIYCIELIPVRNKFEILREFVSYFRSRGFMITFGTEHNAPGLIPVKVTCSGNVPFDDFLRTVGYEGSCVIAAHQYLTCKGMQGYVDSVGKADTTKYQDFVTLGKAVIEYWIRN
jgi:hypothetical protein